MPNLVGIGLSQVPTNSMLGGMAYQDPDRVKIKKLHIDEISQINSETADTAVDVFIYDTSKDSDGGAWRKRTQHTSWYNETLGTTTRGTRREFPAVAVLVLEGTVFTIYDGDDPDLPMWMVFNKGTNSYFSVTTNSCVTALNGKIVSGGNASNDRLRVIDFLLDNELEYSNASTGQRTHLSPISGRNGSAGFTAYDSSLPGIVNRYINDVAMTVLPNAPIDDTTGLPVPTIALATHYGVSVIKDDGIIFDVIDGNSSRKCYDVSFTKDHKLMHTGDLGGGSTYAGNVFVTNILTADRAEYDNNSDLYRWYSTSTNYPRINGGDTFATRVLDPVDVGGHHYAMADVGVSLIEDGTSSSVSNTNGMVAYATTSYNTGYMHGDIKGAFLSDTDTTNVTGSELVTNGTFDSDSDWEKSSHWTISGGSASMPSTGSYLPLYQYNLGLTAGVKYVASVDVSAISGQVKFDTASSSGGSIDGLEGVVFSTTGTHSFTFIAESNQDGIGVARQVSHTSSCTIDNISVRIAEEDRSVNDNGLQVFGTITKSAVATGAELVSYKGTTASTDRLEQPYNSDLDFGTGDFSIMFWIRGDANPAAWQRMFERKGGENFLTIRIHPQDSGTYQGEVMFKFGSAGWAATNYSIVGKGWLCMVFTRVSGTSKMYVNGVEEYSTTSHNGTVNNGSNGFMIDNNSIRLSLLRVSSTTPSPEQIKKIYEDEKVLFQENANATLYGSSDAVTALAYDEVTERLHVGTSSGRSDFQGLRRINNTTTAVTTAISAHDEFIIEQ